MAHISTREQGDTPGQDILLGPSGCPAAMHNWPYPSLDGAAIESQPHLSSEPCPDSTAGLGGLCLSHSQVLECRRAGLVTHLP